MEMIKANEGVGSCKRIRQLRQYIGLTQSKFAARVGVSTSYIAEIELGKKKINDRIFRLISTEFNASELWLRTGEGSMYHDGVKINIVKVTSLFKSLPPVLQECALKQIDALVDFHVAAKETDNQQCPSV